MSDITILRARLRKRDRDIQQAVSNLKLEEGEMADMIRDGFRQKLTEIGALGKRSDPITTDKPLSLEEAKEVARLMLSQRKKSPPSEG